MHTHCQTYTIAPSKYVGATRLQDKLVTFTVTPQFPTDSGTLWLETVHEVNKFGHNWRFTFMVTWLHRHMDFLAGTVLADLKFHLGQLLTSEEYVFFQRNLCVVPTSPSFPDKLYQTYGGSGFAF
jgi:hypothetical protein